MPDSYSCSAYAYDVLNQYGWYAPETPLQFQVNRSGDGFDDVGPVFESFSFSPDTVEVGTENQQVNLSVHLTDQTGVKSGYIYCWGDSQKSPIQVWFYIDDYYSYFYDYTNQSSSSLNYTGDRKDLYLDLTANVPQGQKPGIYTCTGYAYDDLNLYNWFNPETYPTLTVTRVGEGFDDLGPQVYDFTISPNVVEVGTTDAPITIEFDLYDQSGINNGYLYCWGNSNKQPISIWFDLDPSGNHYAYDYNTQENAQITVTGDAQNVSISLESVITFGTKPGSYTCGGYAYDTLGQYGGLDSATTSILTINRTPPGQPGAPSGLTYSPDSASSGLLTWNAPEFLGDPQLKDYQVQFSMDGSNWTTIDDGFSTSTSLPLSNLNGGTNYWFKVRGENGGGEGAWSETIQFTTPQPTLPSLPLDVTISEITASSFLVDWNEPVFDGDSKITNFKVEISSDGGNNWYEVQHMETSATSLAVGGLKANTDYQVRVSSVNIVGASAPTEPVLATTLIYPTSPPTMLVAHTVEATSVTLKWGSPIRLNGSAVLNYVVELSRDSGSTWEEVSKPISVSKSLNIAGLGKGRNYQFRVFAVNAAGSSESSSVIEVTTATTLPAAVSNLALAPGFPTSSAVKITWDAPIDRGGLPITDYKIQYSRNGGKSWIVVEHSPTPKRNVKLEGLKAGRDYSIRVKTVTAKGAALAWRTISFTTPN
jgi:putative component of membrane protein insertase Oxa1/YidC/SpoIIIJ protein YidD